MPVQSINNNITVNLNVNLGLKTAIQNEKLKQSNGKTSISVNSLSPHAIIA